MQKPSERHKLTSDNNIIKLKNPVHDPFKCNIRPAQQSASYRTVSVQWYSCDVWCELPFWDHDKNISISL